MNAAGVGNYVAAIKRWVRPDVPDGTIEVTAHLIFGAAHQLARWFLDHPDVTRDEVVERFAEFCWAGLAPLMPGRSGA